LKSVFLVINNIRTYLLWLNKVLCHTWFRSWLSRNNSTWWWGFIHLYISI